MKAKKYLSYDDAKEWILNNLNVNSRKDWERLVKENKIPEFIPKNPHHFYYKKNRGWLGWKNFIQKDKNKYLSYDDAKNWLKNNININTVRDFLKLVRENKVICTIPRRPDLYYKDFISWDDFLNHKN